jgi:hypothetical protein
MGYLGSKAASGAYQAIIAVIPPHDTYIELFCGSGAVLLRKPSAMRSYAVDLDRKVLARLPTLPGSVRTEKLWLSFRPSAVHWATFAGRDFTDRQRTKSLPAKAGRFGCD